MHTAASPAPEPEASNPRHNPEGGVASTQSIEIASAYVQLAATARQVQSLVCEHEAAAAVATRREMSAAAVAAERARVAVKEMARLESLLRGAEAGRDASEEQLKALHKQAGRGHGSGSDCNHLVITRFGTRAPVCSGNSLWLRRDLVHSSRTPGNQYTVTAINRLFPPAHARLARTGWVPPSMHIAGSD